MAKADLVVIWGTNPVNTQVNVMTHAVKARKTRGAQIAVIDVYRNDTAKQADHFLCVRPGTDGALACAIMHVLFRDGHADRDYLARMTDVPEELEAHLADRSPLWAEAITGVPADQIEALAKAIGETKRTYLRLGYGFTRQRNGAANMHAACSIASVTGAWQYEGGGAFHNNGGIYGWDKSLIEGHDVRDPGIRLLDQTRIGAILTGDPADLQGGPPVAAMLIQNTNPMMVAPDHRLVREGFSREDLFVCVHEQFMTDTARMADVVLPATMFLEHDDIYQGGGHSYVIAGPRIVEAPGQCRSNHEVVRDLARRIGAVHRGFDMTAAEVADETLRRSGYRGWEALKEERWFDAQPDFRTAHYLDGFGWPDGKFRFRPVWGGFAPQSHNNPEGMPSLPDHWDVLDSATADKPFRMATSPARGYLNSTFTETPTSIRREGRPTVMVHPEDAAPLGIGDGSRTRIGNDKGSVVLHARLFDGVRRGVVIVESIWPHHAFEEGSASICSPRRMRRRRRRRRLPRHGRVAARRVSLSLSEIAEAVEGRVRGDAGYRVSRLAHPAEAREPGDLIILLDPARVASVAQLPVRAAVLPEGTDPPDGSLSGWVTVEKPRYALAALVALFERPPGNRPRRASHGSGRPDRRNRSGGRRRPPRHGGAAGPDRRTLPDTFPCLNRGRGGPRTGLPDPCGCAHRRTGAARGAGHPPTGGRPRRGRVQLRHTRPGIVRGRQDRGGFPRRRQRTRPADRLVGPGGDRRRCRDRGRQLRRPLQHRVDPDRCAHQDR